MTTFNPNAVVDSLGQDARADAIDQLTAPVEIPYNRPWSEVGYDREWDEDCQFVGGESLS